MDTPNQWLHAKHDCLLPRFSNKPQDGLQTLGLPAVAKQPRAVVQAAFDGEHWWCNGYLWDKLNNFDDLKGLVGARVLVQTLEERSELHGMLGTDVECVVLDEWFGGVSTFSSMEQRVEQLLARIAHCQNVLRVDFREHNSILSAWKWRNLRRIKKQWSFELRSTHQWMQSMDDRPWQEARMAYDLRPLAGSVLDIRSAYASAVEKMPFPKPGVAWQDLRAGQRDCNALHCIVWEPRDAIGRFYHPFSYSVQGIRAHPGYSMGDQVHIWVLDEDLSWLSRHGTIIGVYQSVTPSSMELHPLADSVSTWRELLRTETEPGYRALHKTRLVSSHSWTWQPRERMLVSDIRALEMHAIEEYSSRLGTHVGGLRLNNDPEIGLIAQGHSTSESGWYTPVAWIRMKLRSHLMRMVEHVVSHGLEIAYVSVDGMHVRGTTQKNIQACYEKFEDTIAPWWQWGLDKNFSKGIWFRPGSYALQNEHGNWDTTNLPDTITGRDWHLWCQTRGTLDARVLVGYWRRPNKPTAWQKFPSIALNAQRKYRCIVRRELNK